MKPIEPGCKCIVVRPWHKPPWPRLDFGTELTVGQKVPRSEVTNGQPCIYCGRDYLWNNDLPQGLLVCECAIRRIDDYEPTVTDVADKDVKEYIERTEDQPA